ncbi:MAG: 2,3-bisphosphoglycerate-independent phosphoglycerate mutase [Candidatus Bilamarchaeaceae archaeon]
MPDKIVLFIMDGLGDLPSPKTALQKARKPNLDRLAREGISGMMSTLWRGIVPGSDTSHMNLFGYPPERYYCGRGPLEALGAGMELRKGDIAFRANFATVDEKWNIIDRRAGRIPTEKGRVLAKGLDTTIDGVHFKFIPTVEHRGVLVMRGHGLGAGLDGTDPHGPGKVLSARGKDENGWKTAEALNKYTKWVYKKLDRHPANEDAKLPANILLVRGAGEYCEVEPVSRKYGVKSACVAGGALYKGVARFVGMDIVSVKGATGDKNTDLKAKGRAVLEALKNHDFVFLHVKATDSFSHDGDLNGKAKFISKVDGELVPMLAKSGAVLVITGDHTTACSRKEHTGYEVPVLVWNKDGRRDLVKTFDEVSCLSGGLGHIVGCDLMPIMLNEIGKGRMSGS